MSRRRLLGRLTRPRRLVVPPPPLRLRIYGEGPGRWAWLLAEPGVVLDSGHADSWAEAMAVGWAALEVAGCGRNGA